MRFRSMLLQAPCLISAIALYDEELLFQNELSVAFCADTGSYLDVLFSLQPESTKQVRDRIRTREDTPTHMLDSSLGLPAKITLVLTMIYRYR